MEAVKFQRFSLRSQKPFRDRKITRTLDDMMAARDVIDPLSSRIQALSQELQDIILDFTLLATLPQPEDLEAHRTVTVDEHCKFPLGLYLNRRSRAAFAKVYVSNFVFREIRRL